MLRSIHKSILLLGLCSMPLFLNAQQPVPAATTPADTAGQMSTEEIIGFTYIPEELRVGVDVSRIITSLVNSDTRIFELNTDLRFGRYYLAADFGAGSQDRSTDIVEYQSAGSFFRIGPDINFIPGDADRNTMFVGLRYGRSWYEERVNAEYDEDRWAPLPVSVDRNTQARWFEGVAGMKAMVWNNIYMGYTLRYKFGMKAQIRNNFSSYDVPGFGRVGDGNTFSFNYHVLYRIPFRK